ALSGEAERVIVSPDGKTCAIQARDGGRVYVVRAGKVITTIHGGASARNLRHMSATGGFEVSGVAFSSDGSLVAVTAGNLLKLYSVTPSPPTPHPRGERGEEGSLRWILPADDVLHTPRFSADGKRIAAGSELGTLYV